MAALPSVALQFATLSVLRALYGMQAFEMRVRPALDNFENGLDRMKLFIYQKFAKYGLPCPVTGSRGQILTRDS